MTVNVSGKRDGCNLQEHLDKDTGEARWHHWWRGLSTCLFTCVSCYNRRRPIRL